MRHALLLFFLLLPATALAANDSIVFSRGKITISPTVEESKQSNKDAKIAPAEKAPQDIPAPLRIAQVFDVVIRNERALDMPGLFTQYQFIDDSGLMILFDRSDYHLLLPNNVLAPMDVLLVADNGTVVQIMPDLTLSELTRPIEPAKEVKAFLYLRAGITKQYDIRPGDLVESEAFQKSPVIIQ